MKNLKYFIVSFGLMTLAYTNINAQPNIQLSFPNGPFAHQTIEGEIDSITFGNDGAAVEVTLTSNLPSELVVTVYSQAKNGEELVRKTSGSPTTSYTTVVFFNSNSLGEGDQVYVECGYKDNNGHYHRDSGCVVIIQPWFW